MSSLSAALNASASGLDKQLLEAILSVYGSNLRFVERRP